MTKCFGSGELTYLPSSFFRCSTYSSDTSPAATSASTQALVRLRAFCLKQMSRSSVPMPYWLQNLSYSQAQASCTASVTVTDSACAAPANPIGYQAEHSYSIASAPEETAAIELAIDRLDHGEVSPFFHDVDVIELRGPIGGHFVWNIEDGGPLFLLGGGSGVVPLMSMLRHRAAAGSHVPALLLFSSGRM